VWRFTCRIAQRLKDEKVPNARIIMLAYTPYDIVPDCEIPDNVAMTIAVFPAIQSDCAKQQRNDKVLTGWRKKLNAPMILRAWPGKYMNRKFPGIPAMHHNLLIDYYTKRRGWFGGGFIDEYSDYHIFRHLNLYLFMKFAWDPQCDLKAVLDEYYSLMFGKGAPFIRQFYDALEKIWDKELVKESIDDALGGNSRVAGFRETWQVIFSDKRIAEFDRLFADALKAAAGDKESCERIRFMREELYGPLRKKKMEFASSQNMVNSWKFRPGETIWLRPRRGQTAEVETRMVLKETPESFVVSFFCEEPEMKRIKANAKGYDTNQAWEDSDVEIFFNPSGDRKNFLQWCINANGAVDDFFNKDIRFKSGAKVEVKRGEKSWQGTLTIPKSVLGNYRKEGFPILFGRMRVLNAPGQKPKERTYCTLANLEAPSFQEPEFWGMLDLTGKPDPNLVLNGNFKDLKTFPGKGFYFTSRRVEGMQNIVLDRTSFVTQGQSVRFDSASPKRFDLQFKTKGMKPGRRYHVSFFCRTELEGQGMSASLFCGNNIKLTEGPVTGSNPWHCVSRVITAPARFTIPNPVVVIGCRGTGKLWIDEVRVEELK